MVNYTDARINSASFKGKALILDFWGTWCAPCVKAFPKLDSLQKKYSGKLYILPVTQEDKKYVASFMKKMEKNNKTHLTSVVNDQRLYKLFPHNTVPHYVWINSEGIVKAITQKEDLTAANIEKLIGNRSMDLEVKSFIERDTMAYNRFQAPLTDPNVMRYNIFMKYIPGIVGGSGGYDNSISVQNGGILTLFSVAYGNGTTKFFGGFDNKKLITDDSAYITDHSGPGNWSSLYRGNWIMEHGYNYALKVPDEEAPKKYDIMRAQLKEYFPFLSATIDHQKRTCLVLKRVGDNKKFESENNGVFKLVRNAYTFSCNKMPMNSFLFVLRIYYQNFPEIINETGYTGAVDFNFEGEVGKIDVLNEGLKKYGLLLSKEERDTEILVLTDLRKK